MNAVSPQWSDFWSEAKAIPIEEVAVRLGAKLRRAGADLVGPCPLGCASNDGFCVHPRDGVFLCRPSGATGSAVDMVMHVHGCTNIEAAEFITGHDRPDGRREETPEQKAERERRHAAALERAADLAAGREREAAEKLKRDEEAVAAVLARIQPFPGSYAQRYLFEGRGIALPKRMTHDLGFVPDLDYFGFADAASKKVENLATLPAMVAQIRDVTGSVVGLHLTYLDPDQPAKCKPPGDAKRNGAKKFRKAAERMSGAMIRLGAISETLVMGEGIETTASFYLMAKSRGLLEEASYGVAMSLGNMCGGALQQVPHRFKKDENGNPAKVRNGVPDPDKPGVILPDHVKRVILLGDGDSDQIATEATLLTGARRYAAEGRVVSICMADRGSDFNDMLKGWRG